MRSSTSSSLRCLTAKTWTTICKPSAYREPEHEPRVCGGEESSAVDHHAVERGGIRWRVRRACRLPFWEGRVLLQSHLTHNLTKYGAARGLATPTGIRRCWFSARSNLHYRGRIVAPATGAVGVRFQCQSTPRTDDALQGGKMSTSILGGANLGPLTQYTEACSEVLQGGGEPSTAERVVL